MGQERRRRNLWPLMLWFPDSMPPPDVAEADVPAPEDPLEGLTDPKERKLAGLLRLWFGLAQMAGATITVVLLWQTGVSSATVMGFVLTTALTVLTRVSFRRHRVGEIRVCYDVTGDTVEVLAIIAKSEVESWLARFGNPE